jgi:ketosteroid isomerase-like protein
MKKVLQIIIFSLTFSTVVIAQSKDEKEVADAVTKLNKALVDADSITLYNLTADELSYGHSTNKLQNKTQFIDDVIHGADFLNIDATDQTITIAGNNAIVRHIFSARLVNNGTQNDVRIGVLMVWQKQKGKWKLLGRQGYKI